MKKAIALLSSLALLASGCNKVQTVEKPVKDSSRHLTVDIEVNCATDTRSVKTGWKTGDVIYVAFDDFFTDNPDALSSDTVYYMTLTFNGSSWVSDFSDEALEQYLLNRESGLLAAVYYSDLSSPIRPGYRLYNQELRYLYLIDLDAIVPGFFMHAKKEYLTDKGINYTVSDGKLTASLNMVLDEYELHFFIDGVNPADYNRYSFKCTDVFYFQSYCFFAHEGEIRAIPYNTLPPAIPVAPRADGIVACGSMYLDNVDKEKEYVVNLIDNNGTPEDESDDITYTLTKTATLHGREAIKLPSLNDPRWAMSNADGTRGTLNGHEWVKMADGKKWSTTNLGAPSRWDPGYYLHYWQLSLYYVLDYESWKGWTTPDYYEWKGLFESTNHTISKMYSMENGQKVFTGVYVTVKEGECKGNSLILPAAGYEEVIDGVPSIIDPTRGYYWVNWYSTGEDGDFAIELLLDPDKTNPIGFARTESGQLYIPVSENTHLLTRPIVKDN